MQERSAIIDCYNRTAKNYASKFMDELDHKHLDQILLSAFIKENKDAGKCIDLGCGPGQTTKYLSDHGLKNILGTDISPAMIAVAKEKNEVIDFETADMLSLQYADQTFGAAIAFYAIVHFDQQQLRTAFTEIKRVLKKDGQFLFSFHIGDDVVHQNRFLDNDVNIDFHFFEPKTIIALLQHIGFTIVDAIEREPYPEIEYASKRAYIWVKK